MLLYKWPPKVSYEHGDLDFERCVSYHYFTCAID